MNSFDARVRYTRMVIENSFLELLQEKPVAKVTVTEICSKAQINRATFYKHYLDVPDLLSRLEENLFDSIRASFADENVKLRSFLIKMMHYTRDNQQRFLLLGGENGDPNLMTKTFLVCYESAYPLMAQNMPGLTENEKQMLYRYLSHGAGAVLTWWIQNGMKSPPEEVADFILGASSITAEGIQGKDWRKAYRE